MYKLIINFKTYKEGSGKNAIKISKIVKELESLAKKKKVEIIVCPQTLDIEKVLETGVKVYAQHIDAFDYGSHTGHVIPKLLKDIGVSGTLINHSEYPLPLEEIEKRVHFAKELGLETCVCAKDTTIESEIVKFNPDLIAVEPPQLIGGDVSISTAEPQLITQSKQIAGKIPLLVGAGVKSTEDVSIGMKLGAHGMILASGVVVKAKDIKKEIMGLIEGF